LTTRTRMAAAAGEKRPEIRMKDLEKGGHYTIGVNPAAPPTVYSSRFSLLHGAIAMRVYQPTRRVRTALLSVALLTFSASAFGQNGHSLVAAAQVAASQASVQPDQGGPTRRLSMDDAVKLALEQNLGIRIQRIDPQIQDLGIGQAKALWTPTLTSSVSRNS